jgi:hypothetical protein
LKEGVSIMSLIMTKLSNENAEMDIALEQMLKTPNGFEKFAMEELPIFIREKRDYESFARKVILAHPVGKQDIKMKNKKPYVVYNKDLESEAATFAQDGEVPQTIVEGSTLEVTVFPIVTNDLTIDLLELMCEQYNYIQRIRDLAVQDIGRQEDKRLISLMEKLFTVHTGQVVGVGAAETMDLAHLVKGKQKLSQWDIPLAAYAMNPARIDEMLLWGPEIVDDTTARELLDAGIRYTLWGNVALITSTSIEFANIYGFAEKEYVGRMPILKDVSTQLTDGQRKLERGLYAYEFIGMYVHSHKAICKISYSQQGE